MSKISAEVLTSWSELERRGTTYFKKSTDEPFTGTLKNFHSNGQIALIDNFKNGKQQNISVIIQMESHYLKVCLKNGKQHESVGIS